MNGRDINHQWWALECKDRSYHRLLSFDVKIMRELVAFASTYSGHRNLLASWFHPSYDHGMKNMSSWNAELDRS